MKHCQWCDEAFNSNVSYQIYCSAECREAATREKIAERYQLSRISRRAGKVRKCKTCDQSLSMYNDDPICSKCLINPTDISSVLKDIKRLSNGKG
jgi:RecJ-like exonuclease